MEQKSYFIQTFGCAMNEYDSERIAAALERKGFLMTNDPSGADIIIYNTCSVREKPQIKIASYLGRVKAYKRKKPASIIGITGCVAQQEGQQLLKDHRIVNFVMGTDAIAHIDGILDRAILGERFADTVSGAETFSIDEFSRKDSVTAHVTIMKGCDNYCSYCIVPYVRGREISRSSSEILNEVRTLAERGVKEVCLLGQNVNSYGKGLSEGVDFSSLLKLVNDIDGLKRIRFITSHPKDFSHKMIDSIASCDKVCKYIHLPLQSGSDDILKRMNRGYTFAEYASKMDYARKMMPGVGFSSDFITGFPGETDEDFKRTLDAMRYAQFDHIFVFNYSPRPGTAAEAMGDDIPAEVKGERLNKILELKDMIMDENLPKIKGSVMEILVTGSSKKDKSIFTGCNTVNRNVNFISDKPITPGDIVNVKITDAKRHSLFGCRVD